MFPIAGVIPAFVDQSERSNRLALLSLELRLWYVYF